MPHSPLWVHIRGQGGLYKAITGPGGNLYKSGLVGLGRSRGLRFSSPGQLQAVRAGVTASCQWYWQQASTCHCARQLGGVGLFGWFGLSFFLMREIYNILFFTNSCQLAIQTRKSVSSILMLRQNRNLVTKIRADKKPYRYSDHQNFHHKPMC